MARRFLINSANTLVGVVDNDDFSLDKTQVDDGFTLVPEATIRRAFSRGRITPGGTWDGTTFTPHATGRDPNALITSTLEALEWWHGLFGELELEGRGRSRSVVNRVHDAMFHGLQGMYLVMVAPASTISIANKTRFLTNWVMGPSDGRASPNGWYQILAANASLSIDSPGLWVRPSDGVRSNLSGIQAIFNAVTGLSAGDLPADGRLSDGAWIPGRTVTS